jgi:hypothetical protein
MSRSLQGTPQPRAESDRTTASRNSLNLENAISSGNEAWLAGWSREEKQPN